MKRYYISIILVALSFFAQAQVQTTAPRTSRGADRNAPQQQAANNMTITNTNLSVRAQMMNEQLTQEIGNARWVRNILREVDLTKEKNAPLYFPVQETNGMRNFFTSVFYLAMEGKVKIYKYQEDSESFDDENILMFGEFLKKFNIYYDDVPASGGLNPVRYIINASDIPSREVNRFFIKEAWYFDQNNSIYDVKTLAICPIAKMYMESGEELSQAMFWVKYEDIRPYIKNNFIMTSNINNAKTYTIDDFFRRRMYEGEIIQTENLLNLPLMKLFETDEELLAEQQRIEDQLKSFNESLWIQPDTTAVAPSKKESKRVTSARSSSSGAKSSSSSDTKSASDTKAASGTKSSSSKSSSKEKTPKQPKPAPAEKATKTSPTRSIRR